MMDYSQKMVLHLSLLGLFHAPALALRLDSPVSVPFTQKLELLRPSLEIPTEHRIEKIRVSEKVLKARMNRAKKDSRVEAFHLRVPVSVAERKLYSKEMAKKGKAKEVYRDLQTIIQRMEQKDTTRGNVKVPLDASFIDKISLDRATEELEANHYNVRLRTNLADPKQLRSLLEQVQGFVAPKDLARLRSHFRERKSFAMEDFLLPSFAKSTLKQYLIFKGPNCFHAALSFHGEDLAKSKYINVKEEKDYHRAMINYDELWRAIQSHFYEINPAQSELKYGDMIVFFDLASVDPDNLHFRWIRHAATYLFGNYTFSKGSKSADTPYTIKTLEDEWRTWTALSKRMGVKVFRRSSFSVTPIPPKNLESWKY
jgi:hypothetical protein